MSDPTQPLSPGPAGAARLLAIGEAAALTGLSRKAIARRVDRGTLRAVKDSQGRRVVPATELVRAGLLTPEGQAVNPGGELVQWQQLYEHERQRAHDLELELVAIANAGPIRAYRLRKRLRSKMTV